MNEWEKKWYTHKDHTMVFKRVGVMTSDVRKSWKSGLLSLCDVICDKTECKFNFLGSIDKNGPN